VSINEIQPDIFVMDMGQNMVGWLRMKVKGKAGDRVQLRFAEMLNNDGTLDVASLRSAKSTDRYILRGDACETWSPSFTYHGFRYVEITEFPTTPTVNNFEGLVVFDEIETTGEFETSDETINQVYKSAYWGIKGNYNGMPTDCPQRDERWGWLGDRKPIEKHYESMKKWMSYMEEKYLKDSIITKDVYGD
jgi:alpha-L-rhamnosidase